MAKRIVLHIGARKTGTTYLQHGLRTRRRELGSAGARYPTSIGLFRLLKNHELPLLAALRQLSQPWMNSDDHMNYDAIWSRIRRDIDCTNGTVILSAEALASLDSKAIADVPQVLGCEHIRVVITMRDLGRVLPSTWQQHVRNGYSTGYEPYLESISHQRAFLDLPGTAHQDTDANFWASFAPGPLVRRWQEISDDIALVTVPRAPGRPEELWERFWAALDLPGPAAPPPEASVTPNHHRGLPAGPAYLLCETMRDLQRRGVDIQKRRKIAMRLGREMLARPTGKKLQLPVPETWRNLVQAWAEHDRDGVEGSRVYGDLSDLQPQHSPDISDEVLASEITRAAAVAFRRERWYV